MSSNHKQNTEFIFSSNYYEDNIDTSYNGELESPHEEKVLIVPIADLISHTSNKSSAGKMFKAQCKDSKRRKTVYPSERQKKKLLQFIVKHPQMISRKGSEPFNIQVQKLWVALANECNAIPGARKTWTQWKKTWQDMRSKTKKKYAEGKAKIIDIEQLKKSEQDVLGLLNISTTSDNQGDTEFISSGNYDDNNSTQVNLNDCDELNNSYNGLLESVVEDELLTNPSEDVSHTRNNPFTKNMYKSVQCKDSERQRLTYISKAQKKALLEFITKHPEMIAHKASENSNYQDSQRLWVTLANVCNAIPGARRTWKQWKKTWQDLRYLLKKKYSQPSTVITKIKKGAKTKLSSTSNRRVTTEFVSSANYDDDDINDAETIFNDWEESNASFSRALDSPVEKKVLIDACGTVIDHTTSGTNCKQSGPNNKSTNGCGVNCNMLATYEQKKVKLKEDYLNYKANYLKQKLQLLAEQTEALKSIAKALHKN